ncbi:MAG: CAP domain-containing protein [Gaiellaceae bacterium]
MSVVNDIRTTRGLRPLRVDGALFRVARTYSATLIRTETFTHGAIGERLAASGARGPVFGENLAWDSDGSTSAQGVVRSWMASPGHRANLLRPGWTRIGIGALKGSFRGYRDATVVTADFAGS